MNTTVKAILETTRYATIATADVQGNPWNTPVFCAYDEEGNIYWSSHPQSVHSQNIQRSGKAFVVAYNTQVGDGEGLGLYMDAKVEMIESEATIALALKLLGERRGRPFQHPEKFSGDGQQRIYRATPLRCWTNDAEQDEDGDFIKDYRVEVSLAE